MNQLNWQKIQDRLDLLDSFTQQIQPERSIRNLPKKLETVDRESNLSLKAICSHTHCQKSDQKNNLPTDPYMENNTSFEQ